MYLSPWREISSKNFFFFYEMPNMIPGFPNGLKNYRALNHDRKVTTNEINKGKILPEPSILRFIF